MNKQMHNDDMHLTSMLAHVRHKRQVAQTALISHIRSHAAAAANTYICLTVTAHADL